MSAPRTGILLLDKPVGLSSNAALQRVRRLAGGIKAGHTGSLDPLASGMLPICLGEATRLAGELLAGSKAYLFGLLLGERSDTGDGEGEIVERAPVPLLSAVAIETVLQRFIGPQQQVPPMYSALKRDGKPLYQLARQGIEVERAPRNLTIYRLELVAFEAPLVTLRVQSSGGTYVRVLGEDIARALGTCGRLASLRREYVDPFADEPMLGLPALEALAAAGGDWPLLAADRAVTHFQSLTLAASDALALRQGRTARLARPAQPQDWRLYDEQGHFLGLGSSDATGMLRVRRLFSEPLQV